ncbi:MAG: hypothetical protein AAFX79_03485 [Planctomycetota bacterium]
MSMRRGCLHRRRRAVRVAVAFSLVEVLLAIFVLGLGLLGLGALIPGIIREQRIASDRSLGVIVANDARAYLRTRADLNRLAIPPRVTSGSGLGTSMPAGDFDYGLGVWLRDPDWSRTYLWDALSIDKALYEDEGVIRLGDPVQGVDPARIGLAERLYPGPSSGLTGPQFVWDFVARRLPPVEADGYALLADPTLPVLPTTIPGQARAGVEIAVFVRRVDTGIRVQPGTTLFGTLLDANPVLPVGLSQGGGPTGTGADPSENEIYAVPLTLQAQFDPTRPGVLELEEDNTVRTGDPGGNVSEQQRLVLAAQIGQQLVDNLGNVFVVDELLSLDANSAEVRVRPAVPSWVPQSRVDTGASDPLDERTWSHIRQVVFVPQPPAAVLVFRTGPTGRSVLSPSGSGAGRQPL